MDFALPSLGSAAAPRPSPDLRPSADAAATARIVRPPAGAPMDAAPPVSPLQAGLVSRSVLEIAVERPGEARMLLAAVDPAHRVLKPFGVGMLPSRDDEGERPGQATGAAEPPDEAGPNAAQAAGPETPTPARAD